MVTLNRKERRRKRRTPRAERTSRGVVGPGLSGELAVDWYELQGKDLWFREITCKLSKGSLEGSKARSRSAFLPLLKTSTCFQLKPLSDYQYKAGTYRSFF